MFSALLYAVSQPHQQLIDENAFGSSRVFSAADFGSMNQTTDHHVQQQTPNNTIRKRRPSGTQYPDAEVIALSPSAITNPNRYVCEVCFKTFQRDQNLQLHRRGHKLPWKLKQRKANQKKKVYVCPEPSCPHHHPSMALGDLTGIKKHYNRKHGAKKLKCDRCQRHYAVYSDWKAHIRNCGNKEYRCNCGTVFNRKDSFVSHRAFCDVLAAENARISANQELLRSVLPEAAGGDDNNDGVLQHTSFLSLLNSQHPQVEHHQSSPPPSLLSFGNDLHHQQLMTASAEPILSPSSLITLNGSMTEPVSVDLAEPFCADPLPSPPPMYYQKKNLGINPPPAPAAALFKNNSLPLHDQQKYLQLSATALLQEVARMGAIPVGGHMDSSTMNQFDISEIMGTRTAAAIHNNSAAAYHRAATPQVPPVIDHYATTRDFLGLSSTGVGGEKNHSYELAPFPCGGGTLAEFPAAAQTNAEALSMDPHYYQQQLLQLLQHQSIGFDAAAGPSPSWPTTWRTWTG